MVLVVLLYSLVLFYIFLYSLIQFSLLIYYLKSKKNELKPSALDREYPMVTIQLPVYNEKYVIERLLDAVFLIDWPKESFEIQVLDDSNDQTTELIEKKLASFSSKGYNFSHIRRSNREGFKAGALAYGLSKSNGEYIAIFDSDFIPNSSFLKQTIGGFSNPKVGVVQTKWSHLNANFSLLTKLQSFGLNNHFTVEQRGRNFAGFFINFNGTAGVWRKTCIENSGGWQSDTLTEDLDLSYRAQLKGWKFIYREDVNSPAELPITIDALKNQQFRWSKGAAECARKNLGKVLKNKSFSFFEKVNAFFHLTNSIMYLCMMILVLLTVPVVYVSLNSSVFDTYFLFANVFFLSSCFIGATYFVANFDASNRLKSIFQFLYLFPLFLSVCMGIGFYVSIGVLQGFLGLKSDFVRTPKFNVINRMNPSINVYVKSKLKLVNFIEIAIVFYSVFGMFYSFTNSNYSMMVFLVMIFAGSSYSIVNSIKHAILK